MISTLDRLARQLGEFQGNFQTTAKHNRAGHRQAPGHGFVHLGRFAEAYRKRFGELPSQTWKRRAPGG